MKKRNRLFSKEVMTLFVVPFIAAHAMGANLVRNGGFDRCTSTNYPGVGEIVADFDNWQVWSAGSTPGLFKLDGAAVVNNFHQSDYLWATQFYQDYLPITEGKEYVIKFDAGFPKMFEPANKTFSVVVRETGGEWTTYGSSTFEMNSSTMEAYEFSFVAPVSDPNARLAFEICGPDEISFIVDNVSMNEVIPRELIKNGGFDNCTSTYDPLVGEVVSEYDNWNIWSIDSYPTMFKHEGAAAFMLQFQSNYRWQTQFYQDNLPITAGTMYTVKFDARYPQMFDPAVKIITVAVEEAGGDWTTYSHIHCVVDSAEMVTSSFTFEAPVSDPNARLTFEICGPTDVDLILDNVSFMAE